MRTSSFHNHLRMPLGGMLLMLAVSSCSRNHEESETAMDPEPSALPEQQANTSSERAPDPQVHEGVLERAGKELDEATEKAAEEARDTTHSIKKELAGSKAELEAEASTLKKELKGVHERVQAAGERAEKQAESQASQ